MDDALAPSSPKHSGEAPDGKTETKAVPSSLFEFLNGEKASAQRFVQALSKRPLLTEDDLTRSRGLVDLEPTRMSRIVELARAAGEATPRPIALLGWCEQIVRSRDDALQSWALDLSQDGRTAFRELLNWAYPLLKGNTERAKRQLAECCLLIGLNVLIARRALSSFDALRQLASDSETDKKRSGTAWVERMAIKQLIRAGAKQLFNLGRVAALFEMEITTAESARYAAVASAGDLRREKEALEGERIALMTRLERASEELGQRDTRISELVAELEGVRVRALHDLGNLKARFRREIGDRLAGLLADAWDAIDTDPPHPTVTRERLEVARDAIRREMEWLNKSSG